MSGLRVLVIDDNEDFRVLIEMALVHEGCTVVSTDELEKAETVLEEGDFGLVVVSDVVGEGDVRAFLEGVHERSDEIAIVMIAGRRNKIADVMEMARGLELERLLHKPIDPNEFVVQVRPFLPSAAARKLVPPPPPSSGTVVQLIERTEDEEDPYADIRVSGFFAAIDEEPPVSDGVDLADALISVDASSTHERLTVQDLNITGGYLVVDVADDTTSTSAEDAMRMAALQKRLVGLRKIYRGRLREQFADLEVRINTVRDNDDDVMVGSAYQYARRIHDTAGSYGFDDVAKGVGTIETLLQARAEGGMPLDAVSWELIDEAMNRCRAAVIRVTGLRSDPLADQRDDGASGSVLRILLVDEDAGFAERLTKRADRRAMHVLWASSLDGGMDVAVGSHIHGCVVREVRSTDLGLFIESLRSIPGQERMPVVVSKSGLTPMQRVDLVDSGVSVVFDADAPADDHLDALGDLMEAAREKRPRVLIVDDDVPFAEQVQAMLEAEHFETRILVEPSHLIGEMERMAPDAIVASMDMPYLGGLDLCRLLRSDPRWWELPILLVTERDRADVRVAAYESGADDCMVKPLLRKELRVRMGTRLKRQQIAQERATRDPATGLLTRSAFSKALEQELAVAMRRHRVLTLCIIDIDRLKIINDTHGPSAGDRVLGTLGQLIDRTFRTEDMRGRWGGEEFILAFMGESAEITATIVGRMQTKFAAMEFLDDEGHAFTSDFSAGISSFPDDGVTLKDLVRAADERLYAAKHAGRGRIVSS